MPNIGGAIIHECNSNVSAFLPPVDELPELTVAPEQLKGDLNLTTFLFEKIQKEQPDLEKIAIELEEHSFSYRQLMARSNSIANSLYSRGVTSGDRVILFLDFSSSALESILGVILTGAIACQNIPHGKEKVQHLVKSLDPKFVFVDAQVTDVSLVLENSQDAFAVVVNPKPDIQLQENARLLYLDDFLLAPPVFPHKLTKGGTIATMFHTSGSTGMPKGCVTSHASWVQGCIESDVEPNPFSSFKKDDKFYPIPPTNSYVFICVIQTLTLGGTLVFSKEKDLPTIMSSLRKGVTWTAATPPLYNKLQRFIKENPSEWKQNASSLKICVSAGETHTAHFANEWKEASGVDLISVYGSTEANIMIGYSPSSIVAGSMGKAFVSAQVEILDEAFNVVPVGSTGLLAIKTLGGCIYWNNHEKQSYYVRNGWNIPKDICKKDKDGNFWFIGREDDLIITKSGGNVSVLEIEGIVQTDKRVIEVAVVGKRATESRDDGKLTLIKALVVANVNADEHGALETDLKSYVALHSDFALDEIEFIDVLPKLPNGKLNRKVLK